MTNNAEPQFRSVLYEVPTTKIELSIACRNLRDRDYFSKSDPMVVFHLKDIDDSSYFEMGRTEVIRDSLNPDFVTKFTVDYHFEIHQKLKFEIYDADCESTILSEHDFLGSMECTLGEIVACQGMQFRRNLASSASTSGMIIIVAEEVKECKRMVVTQFRAENLDKKDIFGKSDPFLVVSRLNDDGSYTVVYKTEVIKCDLNPEWLSFSLPVRRMCSGDYSRQIKVECYDWNSRGSNDFIGKFTTNLQTMLKGPGPVNNYPCINPKKKDKKKNYKNSGTIILVGCVIEEESSFFDYIRGGTQIHFAVAIDFTSSNGNPRDRRSLHYMNPSRPNTYATAIQAVGEIVQDYDSDKLFPVLGFGAMLADKKVSHDFHLNGNANNPYVQGVEGILQAYYKALQTVQLYGPTNFAPVINYMAKYARALQDGNHYFILLIITDGIITDMPRTKRSIIQASSLPLSIIIVGVGNTDFAAMEILDADKQRLCSNGVYAARDIVQFVPFYKFRNQGNIFKTKALLAKEVMAEVPDQLVGFMKSKGIMPKIPPELPIATSTRTTPPPPAYNDVVGSVPVPSWAKIKKKT